MPSLVRARTPVLLMVTVPVPRELEPTALRVAPSLIPIAPLYPLLLPLRVVVPEALVKAPDPARLRVTVPPVPE